MARVTLEQVAQAIDAPKASRDAVANWSPELARWGKLYACKRNELVLYDAEGKAIRKRDRRTLKMAKRVCEDWAGLLWTENATVNVGEGPTQEFAASVFSTAFAPRFTTFLERMFSTGTGIVEVLLRNLGVDEAGNVTGNDGSLRLNYVRAGSVIPLAWDDDEVSEVAIVSFVDDETVDVREHRRLGGAQLIVNRRFNTKASCLKPAPVPEGVAETLVLAGAPPLFSVFKPAIVNNVDAESPYGASVFANAEDQLDAVDGCFDNFGEDFALGGKMVFIPDSMLRRDSAGKPIAPQHEKRNLFIALSDPGGGMSDHSKMVSEYNPSLRVVENSAGISAALSLLSSAVGMGSERYVYRSGTVATATQIVSENSDLFRNRAKHLLAVASGIEGVARAVLWCGANVLGQAVDVDAEVTVTADDSVIEDDGTRIARGLQLFQAGAISQRKFLIDYMRLDEDAADAEVAGSRPAVDVSFA